MYVGHGAIALPTTSRLPLLSLIKKRKAFILLILACIAFSYIMAKTEHPRYKSLHAIEPFAQGG
jgi:hypothetical protein